VNDSAHDRPDPLEYAVHADVARALAEDLGDGDRTAALIDPAARTGAVVVTRESAALCGTAWFEATFHTLDPAIDVRWQAGDGDSIEPGQTICTLTGPARALLSGERTALNFLQTLSGTATIARRYRESVAGLPVVLLDTRKTLPGLRAAQKYAVRCGGCENHRMGLYDGLLIKENHIAACGSIKFAVDTARSVNPGMTVEIEVEDLAQVAEALEARADILLLDNFDTGMLRAAVALNRDSGMGARLEASGGITLENVREIAETGVDRISIGALTKDLRAIDLSMRFRIDR
jgi:nicotinate-nucleotide pyrophosphorylase (carboxylating)